ncbi:MAG TPA: VOC family protein [Kofleriaceae bacterium]|nr:VOC family protein [Kofleriaceae bacterium]
MRIACHLCFAGQCAEAFRTYQRIFGGQLTTLTYGGSPLAAQTPAALHDQILHATLAFGTHELLGADIAPDVYRPPAGFFVIVTVADKERGTAVFGELADGGEVVMPFQETFWSPGFGSVRDRFGTPWEIHVEAPR